MVILGRYEKLLQYLIDQLSRNHQELLLQGLSPHTRSWSTFRRSRAVLWTFTSTRLL